MRKAIALLGLGLTLLTSPAFGQPDGCENLNQRGGVISIPMQTGGQPAVAVLNTGVLPIGISRLLAQDLGLTVEPVPSRNRVWSAIPVITGQVSNVPVTMFGQDLHIEQMYVMDNPARFVYLSVLMFSDFVMQLNMPQSRLCFLNRGAIDMKEAKNIDMKMANGKIIVAVSINKSKPVWLELQLEYPGAIRLNRDAAEQLKLMAADSTESSGVADSLMFGPYELGNIALDYPPVTARDSDAPRMPGRGRRGGGPETSGVLGYEILKHFVVTVDTERERMHVFVPQ